jgi:hypothetical protein
MSGWLKSVAFVGRWSTATLFLVLGIIAGTKPEDAMNNIAAWWQFLSHSDAPVWLRSSTADHAIFAVALVGLATMVLGPWRWFRKHTVTPASSATLTIKNRNVTSHNQSGGITAHTIDVGGDNARRPRSKR